MTAGKKWLGLLALQAGLLGAAYGGGVYQQWQQRQAAEAKLKVADEKLAKAQEEGRTALYASRGRALFLEAALAVRFGNYAMAFERSVRASALANRLGVSLDKEMGELNPLLVAQRPEAVEKLLRLADRIESPPPPPDTPAVAHPPAAAPKAAGVPTATPTPAPAAGLAPGTTAPPAAAPIPSAATGTAASMGSAGAPVAAPPSPPAAAAAPNLAEGRTALLGAKELLILGAEPAQIVSKLAHAQVMLDEAGRTELDEPIGGAIKAVRARDEAKARAAIDGALTQLRGP
ncbi:MAG: hypothetical protein U1A78_13600 [Polyangia bacterium]